MKTSVIVSVILLLLSSSLLVVSAVPSLRVATASSQTCGFGGACWYTGDQYSGSTIHPTSLSVKIVVPSDLPQPGDTHFELLSIYDAGSNYDQIGIGAISGLGNPSAWQFTWGYATNCGSNLYGYYDVGNTTDVGFHLGDLLNFTMQIISSNSMSFMLQDVTNPNIHVTENESFSNNGYFTSSSSCSSVGLTNYEEQHTSCGDVPISNFLFTNNIANGTTDLNTWSVGDTYADMPAINATCFGFTNNDNATEIGQDQGGFNALIYNLYNRQDTGLTPNTESLSLAYSSPNLYAALSQGTCTTTSCAALYAGYGTQPSSFSQVFPKITGEGDGISSLGTPSIATGDLSYLGGNPTIVYAWPRTSDSHALVSYYNGTNGKWYGPFDTGVTVSTSPSVAIAPDPSGSTAIWMAYAASSNQEIHLMYSDNGGLTWRQEAASGQYANQTLSLAEHSGTLYVSWVGANNILDTASFATGTQSWSNVGSLTGVSASGISATYVNTNYPFIMATWEDTLTSEIGLAALSYQQVNSATPTLSYMTYISATTPTNGYDTQSITSAGNQVALGFIYSSTNTFNTYWTQF
ncbi:MAG: hypothetical protein JRN15_05390 [Nitrososphaerota archaeon]|nr:hypothetical protein [Nitrososphaerota archaeon]